MQIQVVGLNHRTAPVELRERLAFDAASASRALAEIRAHWPGAEAVVLSTCNRVELYVAFPGDAPRADAAGQDGDPTDLAMWSLAGGVDLAAPSAPATRTRSPDPTAADDGLAGKDAHDGSALLPALPQPPSDRTDPPAGTRPRGLVEFLAGFHDLPVESTARHLFCYRQEEAVRHLFLVAAGLDSMVLGEYQIVAQVKEAWSAATLAGATGTILNRLFPAAFETAKDVRTRTAIGQGKVSVGSVAVELVREIFDSFADKTILLVGAGKMGELTLRHLSDLGPKSVLVCNRSPERADKLAAKFRGTLPAGGSVEAVPWEGLYDALSRADVVVSSTGAREPVIRAAPFAESARRRRFRTIFLIDIAVPRDIEPAVAEVPNTYLYNIDDLQAGVARTIDGRTAEVARCRAIVDAGVGAFLEWLEGRAVGPLIGQIRDRFREVCRAEMERLGPKLTGSRDADLALIGQAFDRTVGKLLHVPIERIKAAAKTGGTGPLLELMRRLFDLRGA